MRDLAILFVHLLTTIAKLMRPGGARAVVLRPSTLLAFHAALVRRKYRLLFSPKRHRKPGPKGPSPELIKAIVEIKRRNPSWGCRRIAQQLCLVFDLFRCESLIVKSHWVLVVMDQCTRRIIGFGVHAGAVDGPSLCRMFNRAIRGAGSPEYISSDNDPLFRFHQWKANLRILEVTEVKTVPYLPISHPFVERLIGTIRREYLDVVPFWTAHDLENKLLCFKEFYNNQRCHFALDGDTPGDRTGNTRSKVADLDSYRWKSHCKGLYQLPVAA